MREVYQDARRPPRHPRLGMRGANVGQGAGAGGLPRGVAQVVPVPQVRLAGRAHAHELLRILLRSQEQASGSIVRIYDFYDVRVRVQPSEFGKTQQGACM